MLVSEALSEIAVSKNLRRSTYISYERLMGRLGLLEACFEDVTQEQAVDLLWKIDNPNTRRAAVIALRSIFGWKIKIPRSIPRRYVLPDENTLRFALMLSPHQGRGLLMMYAGLRIGEACAVTKNSLRDGRLVVDRQVLELQRKGEPTTFRLADVKTESDAIVVPDLLIPVIQGFDHIDRPSHVRESLRRAGVKAGIQLNPHMLRKWYCNRLFEHGAPLELIRRQMRHSDITTTLTHYQQFNESDIKKIFG